MTGPLGGIRVVELEAIGPAQLCGMLLADLGAEVLRIDRPAPADLGARPEARFDLMGRGRRSVALDLKDPAGQRVALALVERADVLVEGFRPGVMERLGLGPDACTAVNERLVYARATGWGQTGPDAEQAGHDLDYIAVTGALHALGRAGGPPTVPLGLVGDFGGGALYTALGICAALVERAASGRGQVVDGAAVDGSANLMTYYYGQRAAGAHHDERGTNVDDSGAPFYEVYRCADGSHLAVAAIEERFQQALYEVVGVEAPADRWDRSAWPATKEALAAVFATRTRDDWMEAFAGRDACVAPVLGMGEAPSHPHLRDRGVFVEVDGVVQPAPAPRFSRTPGRIAHGPPVRGADTRQALADWGIPAADIDAATTGAQS